MTFWRFDVFTAPKRQNVKHQKIANPSGVGAASPGGISRSSATCAWGGPRRNHLRNSSTADVAPRATTSTLPSGKLRALPQIFSLCASIRVL